VAERRPGASISGRRRASPAVAGRRRASQGVSGRRMASPAVAGRLRPSQGVSGRRATIIGPEKRSSDRRNDRSPAAWIGDGAPVFGGWSCYFRPLFSAATLSSPRASSSRYTAPILGI
jgi:hypothetical protein